MTMPQRASVLSRHGIGLELAAINIIGGANAAYPTANLAIFVPIRITVAETLTHFWWENGATLTNNADIGLYTTGGVRLASTGSTARSGTSAIQRVSASLSIARGTYYLGFALAGTTGTMRRIAPANIGSTRALGIMSMATAFPLPDPVTFAAATTPYIPMIGMDFS